MRIEDVPFTVCDWKRMEGKQIPGDAGTSDWRTYEKGNIRVRMVDYSPGFRSDHWCPRGHVLLVLEGELTIALKDGREFHLLSGSSFQVSDDEENPHLASTSTGAKVFIVD